MAFDDVKSSDWFYNDVKTAYETGLINGKSETAYAPNDNMTYAEAIKLAACMNQYAAKGEVTLESGNPWYKTYVDYARDKGIISKEYDYNKNASRNGYMEIFASCLPDENLKGINSIADNSIPDVPSKAAYAPAVYKLYRAGILTGVDAEHNCNPTANIKRSEVAAILTRMMNADKRISFSMGSNETETDDPKTDDPKTDETESGKLTVAVQPEDALVAIDADASFTVEVTGGKAPYTYEWYYKYPEGTKFFICKDKAEYYEWFRGVDTATLTVKQLDSSLENSEYQCVITDAEGNSVTSEAAKLSVDGIKITVQPQSVTVDTGADATFTVQVSGGKAPYTYEWYYKYPDGTKFIICKDKAEYYEWFRGVDTATLTVKQLDSSLENSEYQCKVTDAYDNSVTSDAAVLAVTE